MLKTKDAGALIFAEPIIVKTVFSRGTVMVVRPLAGGQVDVDMFIISPGFQELFSLIDAKTLSYQVLKVVSSR
jgi:hypothetical protein